MAQVTQAVVVYVKQQFLVAKELQVRLMAVLSNGIAKDDVCSTVRIGIKDAELLEAVCKRLVDHHPGDVFAVCGPQLLIAIVQLLEGLHWLLRMCDCEGRTGYILAKNKAAICLNRSRVLKEIANAEHIRDAELSCLWRAVDSQYAVASEATDLSADSVRFEFPPKPDGFLQVEELVKQLAARGASGDCAGTVVASLALWRKWYAELSLGCAASTGNVDILSERDQPTTSVARLHSAAGCFWRASGAKSPAAAAVFRNAASLFELVAENPAAQLPCQPVDLLSVANLLEVRLRWMQRLETVRPAVILHRSKLEGFLQTSAALCHSISQTAIDDPSQARQLRTTLAPKIRLPEPQHFYLAEHYAEQGAAAVKLEHTSEYHAKLAHCWGAAEAAMCEYFSLMRRSLEGEEVSDLGARGLLTKAQICEQYGVRMTEDALRYHLCA